ncbi:hypothetical protein REPUB_Repub11eG0156600 [Reevesia pubescens]
MNYDHDHGMEMPPSSSSNGTLGMHDHMMMMMMHMTFFWGKNAEILFSGWPEMRAGMYAFALIFIFLLAFLVEWIVHSQLITFSHSLWNGSWHGNATIIFKQWHIRDARPHDDDDDAYDFLLGQERQDPFLRLARYACRQVCIRLDIHLSSCFPCGMDLSFSVDQAKIKPRSSHVSASLVQTLLHAMRIGIAYLVMLDVMSFNGGVFLMAVAGHTLGFLLFGSRVFKKNTEILSFEKTSDLPPMNC